MSFSLGDKIWLYKDYDITNGTPLGEGAFGLTIIILLIKIFYLYICYFL